jgi:hypothetical protein
LGISKKGKDAATEKSMECFTWKRRTVMNEYRKKKKDRLCYCITEEKKKCCILKRRK